MIKKLTYLILLACMFIPTFAHAQSEASKAKVIDVITSEQVELEGLSITTTVQTINVLFVDGPHAGTQKTFVQDKFVVEEGETVFVQETEDGKFQLLEKDRTQMILWTLALFLALIVLHTGKQGVKSILGLALSFAVIIFIMLPLVLKGFNPLIVSVFVGAAVLSADRKSVV